MLWFWLIVVLFVGGLLAKLEVRVICGVFLKETVLKIRRGSLRQPISPINIDDHNFGSGPTILFGRLWTLLRVEIVNDVCTIDRVVLGIDEAAVERLAPLHRHGLQRSLIILRIFRSYVWIGGILWIRQRWGWGRAGVVHFVVRCEDVAATLWQRAIVIGVPPPFFACALFWYEIIDHDLRSLHYRNLRAIFGQSF